MKTIVLRDYAAVPERIFLGVAGSYGMKWHPYNLHIVPEDARTDTRSRNPAHYWGTISD